MRKTLRRAALAADPGDCVFFAAGPPAQARALLGAARLEIGQRLDPVTDQRAREYEFLAGDGFADLLRTQDAALR